MSTEQLAGLQLAVNLLDGDRDAFVVCHRHPIHWLEPKDAEIAGEYLSAIDAIRAEHQQRVTLQHHAADLAQEIEDLRFAAEAAGRRIAELEGAVNRLSPTADEVRYTADQDWAGLSGSVAWHLADRHGEGWAGIGSMMEAWRDAEVRRVTAELEAERDALRARLSAIEAQGPVAKIHADGYWTARRGYDPLPDGKAFLSVYARPVPALAVDSAATQEHKA